PPPSAQISNRVASGQAGWPAVCHQVRIVWTANAAVSWSVPTLTHPASAAMSYTPVGDGLAQLLADEVVHVHPLGVAPGPPFPPAVPEVADILFLLGVHADHRLAGRLVGPGLLADMAELRVPVRVLAALGGPGVALQAEVLLAQKPGHGRRRRPVPGPAKLGHPSPATT